MYAVALLDSISKGVLSMAHLHLHTHICALMFACSHICLVLLDYIVNYHLALDPGPFSSFSTLVSPCSSIPHVSPLFSSQTPVHTLSTVCLFSYTPQSSCQHTEILR